MQTVYYQIVKLRFVTLRNVMLCYATFVTLRYITCVMKSCLFTRMCDIDHILWNPLEHALHDSPYEPRLHKESVCSWWEGSAILEFPRDLCSTPYHDQTTEKQNHTKQNQRCLKEHRLRVVPLSLSPPCVTRKKTAKKMTAWNPVICFAVFFRITHDGLSERGITRSLERAFSKRKYTCSSARFFLSRWLVVALIWIFRSRTKHQSET